jgi:hypothetical protein
MDNFSLLSFFVVVNCSMDRIFDPHVVLICFTETFLFRRGRLGVAVLSFRRLEQFSSIAAQPNKSIDRSSRQYVC